MNNKVKFLRGTSNEYAVAEKDSDAIYFTTDDGKLYIGDKEVSGDGSITIDDTLSDTSTNPVQNKVVKQAIDNKADKSLYGDITINVGRKSGTTVGAYSTAEGYSTTASGKYSHTEGYDTTASGYGCHAEGLGTTASGQYSHAAGLSSIASGDYSYAGGRGTKALRNNEVAYGKYNESNDDTLFSIGDGTADDARHNAFEITTTGGKLHDKDIATTDLIPTTLPANGGNADYATNAGNADTVNGLHASDFMPYIGVVDDLFAVDKSCICAYEMNTLNTPLKAGLTESGGGLCIVNLTNGAEWANYIVIPSGDEHIYSATSNNGVLTSEWRRINDRNADTVGGKVPEKIFYDNGFSTDLNDATQSGCYAASPDTLNAPLSSWWLVDTTNFNKNQFIVQKAHTLGNTKVTVSYIRNYANDVWSDWKEISTTPIKKISFPSVATNAGGGGALFSADFGTPIMIACTSRRDTQCTQFVADDAWLVLAKDAVSLDPVPAGSYSFDVWYI